MIITHFFPRDWFGLIEEEKFQPKKWANITFYNIIYMNSKYIKIDLLKDRHFLGESDLYMWGRRHDKGKRKVS